MNYIIIEIDNGKPGIQIITNWDEAINILRKTMKEKKQITIKLTPTLKSGLPTTRAKATPTVKKN